ncbi:hypothetical protein KCP78_23125 [Salmonella enterica subsp. enterica]|nr:hypothetical protein KCP78_23125 [Salmonella enterica subsp. enterica]
MVKQLGCCHCDTACSECLLDSQTRHAHDRWTVKPRRPGWGVISVTISVCRRRKNSPRRRAVLPSSIEDAILQKSH